MPLQQTSGNVTADAYGGGTAAKANYIEDVFSTYLYTGNGSTQTINNGIDLAGKGGLVWLKPRNDTTWHNLIDTVRGGGQRIFSNDTSGNSAGSWLSFNANGFNDLFGWTSSQNIVSWTLRKQPKFFDVVTYTGTGANTTIAHSLGSTPGCIMVKRTDTTGNWQVYHNGLTSAAYSIQLNLTNAQASATTVWNSTAPTSSVFSVGTDATVNASGGTYVAYLFAHNAGGFGLTGTDNVISCGSYTGNGSTSGPIITLGYEPQWLLIKNSSNTLGASWQLIDNMRGMSLIDNARLFPNVADAEATGSNFVAPLATGFQLTTVSANANKSGDSYIYIAIRRGPMKVPTDGTKVFAAQATAAATNGTPTTNRFTSNFPVDLLIQGYRDGNGSTAAQFVVDRLRGSSPWISTSTTGSENANTTFQFASQTGLYTSSALGAFNACGWMWQRAPGFFDEVCWTATGSTVTQNHNLGVAPELVISKYRSGSSQWYVNYNFASTTCGEAYLSLTNAGGNYAYSAGTGVAAQPTSTQVQFLSATAGITEVAYLFASCPGVSKVGSYTGNGTTQTINCGFAGGARFVLIKRTDSTGDWYVYDTARGMTTLTDPYLLMNSTAAESATLGSVTSVTTGFALNASILAAINTNAASYIYLAIA